MDENWDPVLELYECSECGALSENILCRWHWKRQKQPPKPVDHGWYRRNQPPEHVSSVVKACFYCATVERLTRDHVIPKSSAMGLNRPWNKVWACEFCNRKKKDYQLAEWLREVDSYVVAHGWNGVHVKYRQVLTRSRGFITELLTDPYRPELRSFRARIDPWFGDEARAPLRFEALRAMHNASQSPSSPEETPNADTGHADSG